MKPDDILPGDDSSVLVTPLEHAADILAVARTIADREAGIENALREGATLKEARGKAGYHPLQTAENKIRVDKVAVP